MGAKLYDILRSNYDFIRQLKAFFVLLFAVALCNNTTLGQTTCAITASVSSASINNGQSATWSYVGCIGGTVSWDNAAGNGNNLVVTPSLATTYTATCTPSGGGATCTSMANLIVIPCSISASASLTSVTSGQSTLLSYLGCPGGTVTWANGVGTGNNISVSPTINTTYTASCQPTGTGSVTCTDKVVVSVSTCSITAGATATTINAGQTINLSNTGCANGVVSWDNGGGNGNLTLSPTVTTIYTATCTLNGSSTTCTSPITVTVKPCAITANASNLTVALGQNTVLSYTGCTNGTVEWFTTNSIGMGNNLTVTPSGNTTYTAVCTPTAGGTTCTSPVSITIAACQIMASATTYQINVGQSTTLSYTGCVGGTVSWDNGLTGTNNIVVSPTADITYTVTCTPTSGSPCDDFVDILVDPCTITATATALTINAGQSSTLSNTGCANGSVTWSNSNVAVTNLTVSPTSTTTYTATCTPTGGGTTCTNAVSIVVTAPLCNITITTQPSSVNSCAGGSLSLNVVATSPQTIAYQWFKGTTQLTDFNLGAEIQTGSATNTLNDTKVNGLYSGNYSVRLTTQTCVLVSNVSVVTIIDFVASPISSSINIGSSASLTASGCTGGTVSWNNSAGTGTQVQVSPTVNTTYTATCTIGSLICTSQVVVNVIPCSITATATALTINAGQSSTLSNTGCSNGTITWSNSNVAVTNLTVSPNTTTTYIATCTPTGGGTTCTSQATINVIPCTITATATALTINVGQSSTLSNTGCANGLVTWSNSNVAVTNLTVSPAATTTYTATCTPTGGGTTCTNAVSIVVSVPLCNITITTQPSSVNSCAGGSLSLNVLATSPQTIAYQWFKGTTQLTDFNLGAEIQTGSATNTLNDTKVNGLYSGNYTVRLTTQTCVLVCSVLCGLCSGVKCQQD